MFNFTRIFFAILVFAMTSIGSSGKDDTRLRARQIGINVGRMRPGAHNSITDVGGVQVGHTTLIRGDSIRTGVTAILPHMGNIFQEKVPAAVYAFNAFGKLSGSTQVAELGNIETPIILTNTLNVGTAVTATVKYILGLKGNEKVGSVNAVVGETNDGYLNDIRGMHVSEKDVINAITSAVSSAVKEGNVGAGTGTRAFGYKGGIGTASRVTAEIGGKKYIVGVLVQSNFGHTLNINGIPFSLEMRSPENTSREKGSCMIVIATDAPLSARNLERLAKRSFAGMARTSAVMSNGSGDFAIAFSTSYRIPYVSPEGLNQMPPLMANDKMTIFFQAVEEATQEAIYNSIFMATGITGFKGRTIPGISLKKVRELAKKYNLHHPDSWKK